jgi:protein-disulfide isomerase
MIKLCQKLLLGAAMLTMPLTMAYAASFSSSQTKDIESIVHGYLTSNPEVLVEASQAYKNKQLSTMKQKANNFIGSHKKEFFGDSHSPVAGNAKGNVTLVEFFDYQCGHCKQMASTMTKLTSNDKNLRVVYKQLPIFKGGSLIAAKAALAAEKQGKFMAMHEGLMNAKKPLTETNIMAIAKSSGLNVKQLQKDMASSAIQKQIDANMKLAESFLKQSVGYVFTPIFVVSNQSGSKYQFIPGGLDYASMTKMIKEMRSSK